MLRYGFKGIGKQAVVAAALLAISSPLYASPKKDVGLVGKVVSFIQGGPKGAVDVAIVFDPANPDSAAHADEMAELMAGKGGKVKLTGKKVPVSAISGASEKVIFVTRGMSAHYGAVAAKGKGGVLTISNDASCLGGGCAVIVKSDPSVDILVSSAATSAAGIEFASAFSMMITKK